MGLQDWLLLVIVILQAVIAWLTKRQNGLSKINKDTIKDVVNEVTVLFEQRTAKRIQRGQYTAPVGQPLVLDDTDVVGRADDFVKHIPRQGG